MADEMTKAVQPVIKLPTHDWYNKTLEVVWNDYGRYGIRFTMPDGSRITQHFEAPADLACLLASAVPA